MIALPRLAAAAAIIVLCGALAACGGTASQPDSGVAGLVLIGPMCPVMQEDVPCPDEPFEAEIRVLERGGSEPVATARSGPDGRFRIALEPGAYTLEPVSPNEGAPPFAAPIDVEVRPGAFTEISVLYDSGIR